MIALLADILGQLPFGFSFVSALEGFDETPNMPRATRLRGLALGTLLLAAGFSLTAAILWRPGQKSLLIETLGWIGFLLLIAFIYFGNRLKRERQQPPRDAH